MENEHESRMQAIENLIAIIQNRKHIPKVKFQLDKNTIIYLKKTEDVFDKFKNFKKRLEISRDSDWIHKKSKL